jgi:hypothetical protein
MRTYECRRCGRPIVWITTPKGKLMPCDAQAVMYWEKPGAPGKVVTTTGDVVSCEFTGQGPPTGCGYVSHFATCPGADEFRK